MEFEPMTRQRGQEIFEEVLHAAHGFGVRDIEVACGVRSAALTRFANNTIHQNVSERGRYLSVRAVIDHRTARATTNRWDRDSVRKAVEEAIAITRSRESDPDLLPLADPEPCAEVERFCESTALATPEGRARAVAEAIEAVESEGHIAAGIYSTEQSADAQFNSRGVSCYHTETMAVFSITAMAGNSSGWAKASSPDCRSIDPVGLARRAAAKSGLSANPTELDPGRYTVVLEPAAVLDVLGQMFPDFSGTALADRRSFLTGRLGERLFGNNITIHDDVHHPLQAGSPFDGEGVPRQRLTLVKSGVPSDIAYSRLAAAKAGKQPTGHGFPLPNEAGEAPMNIVISGGDTFLEDMIAETSRGILVTRLWYIREVEPYEKIMTGMTRDGTFLIEDGSLVRGLKNFRFNQGLIEMLSNVEAMSPAERASGEEAFDMVVPAMKVNDFQFTEVTRF